LNSGPSPWATQPALFLWRVFQDKVSQTFCLGWLRTKILLISASWVGRITCVNHRWLARREIWTLLEEMWTKPACRCQHHQHPKEPHNCGKLWTKLNPPKKIRQVLLTRNKY
jgi:hypothetical protein